ncbi:hypothetical protein [Nannocystis sp.]|uniref:hypothetical protein n=1 Tax=Nannocystis sp. TaxID=1962667 RepID=UPI002421B8F7|nr:hypothetical protein [Nannocystis sp.]MBK7829008.1 hypothetical protein [Nannocystis sp.]MBK9757598.1 hypothetical protein [Nannocystis sp.]
MLRRTHRIPTRSLLARSALTLGLLAGLGLGLACNTSGSQNPGSASGGGCPGAKPRNGASCPRGESDFCVYRSGAGDHVCACGSGHWRCAKK